MKTKILKYKNKSLINFFGGALTCLTLTVLSINPLCADPILGRTDPPVHPYVYKRPAHRSDYRFSHYAQNYSSRTSYSNSNGSSNNSGERRYGNAAAESMDWYYSQPAHRISSAFYTDRAGRVRKLPDLQGAVVTSHLWSYRDEGGELKYSGDPLGQFANSQGLHVFPTMVYEDGSAYNGPSGWISPQTLNQYYKKSSNSPWE